MYISVKEINRNLVYPIWRDKVLTVIDGFFHPNADIRTTFRVGKGPEILKESIQDIFNAFPFFAITIEDIIKEQNKLIYKWKANAKHEGYLLNIEPTGKDMIFSGVVYAEMEEGLIITYHSFSNIPQILGQHSSTTEIISSLPCPYNEMGLELDEPKIFNEIREKTGAILTKREIQTLILWLRGYTMKDTAKFLGGISHKTIQSFRDKVKRKLKVRSYQKLFTVLLNTGILSSLLGHSVLPDQESSQSNVELILPFLK